MMSKKLVQTILIFSLFSFGICAQEIKKGVKIYVELSPAGSFEITGSRFKGGKIKRKGDKFSVSDIYIPTNKLKTGIDLRDEHMRKRIKNDSVLVKKAEGVNGEGKGVILIRDVEKDFSFTYRELDSKFIRAKFTLNLSDFKIPDISYMGVGVEDKIKVEVILPFN